MPRAKQSESSRCARCQNYGMGFNVRSEQICLACFIRYITMKVIKRLESNKLRAGYGETSKKILVPVSFGVSSLSLLSILDAHMQRRLQQGRHGGYTIYLLFVDESTVLDRAGFLHRIDLLKERFPAYEVATIALQDCFDFGIHIDKEMLTTQGQVGQDSVTNSQRLLHLIAAMPGPSSKADVLEICRRRIIAAYAQRENFDFVLYGDTTTRLSEKTLAETAKGRGGSIPWQHADGNESVEVPYVYPMRDLLRKEVQKYAEIADSLLTDLIAPGEPSIVALSLRNSSIDDIMRQYIESVEENYPSIVANVVRTVDKLRMSDTT